MKKIILRAFAIILVLVLVLTGCGISAFAEVIPSNQYRVYVQDEYGNPLSGCRVIWQDLGVPTTKYTNDSGYADFSRFTVGDLSIRVFKDGYVEWRNDYYGWKKSEKHAETVTLYLASTGDLRLKSAVYNNSTDVTKSVKKLSLGNDCDFLIDASSSDFTLSCRAYDTSMVSYYELFQGDKSIAKSNTGDFSLQTSKFKKGSGVYVVTHDTSGMHSYITHLKLDFYKMTLTKNIVSLDMGKLSVSVPDNIPFVGGDKVEVALPVSLPITAAISGDKFKIGFGLNQSGSEEERIEALNKTADLIDKLDDAGLNRAGKMSDAQRREFNKLVSGDESKTTSTKFFKNCVVNVLGYAECDFIVPDDGDFEITKVTGKLVLQISVDVVNFSWTTWVVVLPVTVNIKVSAGLDATVSFSYDLKTESFTAGFNISPFVSLNVFGGVGVGKVCGIGAYGVGKLQADIAVSDDPCVTSLDLTGELGVKAYWWIFSYSKAFARNTWNLYTRHESNEDGEESAGLSYAEMLSGMDDASQYTREDLAYLDYEGTWIGSATEDDPRLVTANDIESAEASFTTLFSGTYRNARPVMVSSNGKIYAAFIRADRTTGRQYSVATCYSNGTWSTLKETDVDAAMTDEPKLSVSGNNIYLSYMRMPSDFDMDAIADLSTDAQMLAYANAQQLVIGRLDPDTLNFTVERVIEGNGYLHGYDVYADEDGLTVAWLDSAVQTGNDVLKPDNAGIGIARLTDDGWSETETVTQLNGDIRNLTIGSVNGEPVFAYTIENPDSETDDESATLYMIDTAGAVSQISDECSGKVTFSTVPGTGEQTFVWNTENALMSASGEIIPAAGITGNYVIIGDCVYYSAAVDNASNLTRLQYVDGVWTDSIEMIGDSCYLENLSVVDVNGEAYVLGMNTSVTIAQDEDSADASANLDDSKDMVFARMFSVSDLVLDDINYTFGTGDDSDNVYLNLFINNAGDHAVSSVEIYMDGQLVKTDTSGIAIGSYAEIPLTIDCPLDKTTYSFEVREPNWTQHCAGSNKKQLTLGYSDFVTEISLISACGIDYLLAEVTNTGVTTGYGTLTYTLIDSNGATVFGEEELMLVSGELFYELIAVSDIEHTEDTAVICLNVENSDIDYDPDDNSDLLSIKFSAMEYIQYDNMLVLPDGLKTIENEAFEGDSFVAVVVDDACKTIGARAFAGNPELKQVLLPESVKSIASNAFDECDSVVIWCAYGSYAAEYARKFSIPYHYYTTD